MRREGTGGGVDVPEELFGPYRLVTSIGRGGTGEVFRAIDTRTERVVALERFPPGLVDDDSFVRETELATRLRDPHVVPVHDHGVIDGQPFIEMRLVDGEDLGARLRRCRTLDPAAAVELIEQVASALDAAPTPAPSHRP